MMPHLVVVYYLTFTGVAFASFCRFMFLVHHLKKDETHNLMRELVMHGRYDSEIVAILTGELISQITFNSMLRGMADF